MSDILKDFDKKNEFKVKNIGKNVEKVETSNFPNELVIKVYPKIRIESDGYITQVWIDGEKVECATRINFTAVPGSVYCKLKKYKKDDEGKFVIKNDELVEEIEVIVDTFKNGLKE